MLFVNLSVVWAWGIDLSFDNNPPFLLKMNLLYEIPRYNTVLRYLVPRYIIQVLPWCHELQLPGRLPSPYLIKLDATTTALWRGWSHWSWFYRWLARCPDGYGEWGTTNGCSDSRLSSYSSQKVKRRTIKPKPNLLFIRRAIQKQVLALTLGWSTSLVKL